LDKVICKGSLDHFPHPAKAVEEMARVLKPQGEAIIVVANFESLGFRLGKFLLALRKRLPGGNNKYNEKLWQIPPDHSYKFDYPFLRRLVEPHLKVDRSTGVSLLFGLPRWSSLLARLPKGLSLTILKTLDRLARHLAPLSDAIVLKCSPGIDPGADKKSIS
jgi:SAM-dependent methyltransferase